VKGLGDHACLPCELLEHPLLKRILGQVCGGGGGGGRRGGRRRRGSRVRARSRDCGCGGASTGNVQPSRGRVDSVYVRGAGTAATFFRQCIEPLERQPYGPHLPYLNFTV
jgi:hypothetical protein